MHHRTIGTIIINTCEVYKLTINVVYYESSCGLKEKMKIAKIKKNSTCVTCMGFINHSVLIRP